MFKVLPKFAKADPLSTIHVLRTISEALAAVFGSPDDELLGDDDVRAGFMYVAAGVSASLSELEEVVGESLTQLKAASHECDTLKAQLAASESAFDYVLEKYSEVPGMPPLSLAEAASFMRKRKEGVAPDLTEPVSPIANGEPALAG